MQFFVMLIFFWGGSIVMQFFVMLIFPVEESQVLFNLFLVTKV